MKHDPPPNDGNGTGWFRLPNDLPKNASKLGLLPVDLAVLTVIMAYATNGAAAWPSETTIGEHIGITNRTVIRSLNRLKRTGIVEVQRRKQMTSLYSLRPEASFRSYDQEVHEGALQKPRCDTGVTSRELRCDTGVTSRELRCDTGVTSRPKNTPRSDKFDTQEVTLVSHNQEPSTEVQNHSTAVVSTVRQIFDSLPDTQRQAALILHDWSLWKLQPIKTKGRIAFDAQTYPTLNLALCAQNMVDYYNSQDGKDKNGHAVNGPLTWGKWLAREAARQPAPAQAQANNDRDEIEQEAIRQTLAFREMHERETAELRGKAR